MKRTLLLLVCLLTSLALAVTYRVVDDGGPLTLAEDVAAAFAAWNEAEESEIEAEVDPDAATLIRYGDSARFGPDTVSLTTLERQDDTRTVGVLLSPNAGADQTTALLHETGVLLGLSPADRGVMNPLIGTDAPQTLTDADRDALQALQRFVPADLNRDGVVDFYDLAEFGGAFGRSGVNLPADINGDGDIDDADLAQLRDAYTFSPPSETPPSETAAEPETDDSGPRLPVGEEEFPDLTEPGATEDGSDVSEEDAPGDAREQETESPDASPPTDDSGDGESDGESDGEGNGADDDRSEGTGTEEGEADRGDSDDGSAQDDPGEGDPGEGDPGEGDADDGSGADD